MQEDKDALVLRSHLLSLSHIPLFLFILQITRCIHIKKILKPVESVLYSFLLLSKAHL